MPEGFIYSSGDLTRHVELDEAGADNQGLSTLQEWERIRQIRGFGVISSIE
jgi:hypothetical protein